MLTSGEIRQRFLDFFEKRGHAIIPSASLIPENDPSVLFTTAGMQPLVPYLLGQPHPKGDKLASVQKCVRTVDIDEIGDNTHLTFFEMLGNWSLGSYFKREAITWSFEFLTSKTEGLGLDPKRLYITVFEGNEDAPRDDEAADIWKEFIDEKRIFYMGVDSNWWSPGPNGPCGPDTEMFYDLTPEGLGDITKDEFIAADEAQDVIEIWNDVFMEYEKKDGRVIGKLQQKNVDTGSGLERITAVVQGKDNIFESDIFTPLFNEIDKGKNHTDPRAERIIVDHIRTSVFLIADGVVPSNTDQGYILRRLIRRAVRYADVLGIEGLTPLARIVIESFKDVYAQLDNETILSEIKKEEIRFRETLTKGLREFEKATDPFILFTTFGFPLELTKELAREKGIVIDEKKFHEEMDEHKAKSRIGAEQKFKGGLADVSEMTVKYHTATHLLLQALKEILGSDIKQKGSNITSDRLRFDFSYPEKISDQQLHEIEEKVNAKIQEDLPINSVVMAKDDAMRIGAEHTFIEKYGDEVTVYFIGNDLETAYSKEFCGGPHVKRTSELGMFRIIKEEAVSAGVRRIKAILE